MTKLTKTQRECLTAVVKHEAYYPPRFSGRTLSSLSRRGFIAYWKGSYIPTYKGIKMAKVKR